MANRVRAPTSRRPIARVLGKREPAAGEHLEEAAGAAAVLDIGLAVGIGGAEVERIARADEFGKIVGHAVMPTALLFHFGVTVTRVLTLLNRLDG